jgi:hypothetical protein
MIKLYCALSIVILNAARLSAADYCSLEVRVVAPSGKPVETRVVVVEMNGRKAERTSGTELTKFCGLGVSPVSIAVGDAGCNQVVVRNVPLRWRETTHLSVMYDDTPCLGEDIPVAACAFLLRFVDGQLDPVGAVSFEEQKPFLESRRGDEFGRVFVRIAAGQELVGVASAKGYKSAKVSLFCESKNQKLEQLVALERSSP